MRRVGDGNEARGDDLAEVLRRRALTEDEARPEAVERRHAAGGRTARENLEDLYLGVEGPIEQLAKLELRSRTSGARVEELGEGRFALKLITRRGCERAARFFFLQA